MRASAFLYLYIIAFEVLKKYAFVWKKAKIRHLIHKNI